jgi:hypothetical protein
MLLLTVASESGFREHRQPRLEVPADSTEPDFERLDPTFRAVISSVKLEAPFPYRERSLFARAMASITVPALFGSGCTIGALLGIPPTSQDGTDRLSLRKSEFVGCHMEDRSRIASCFRSRQHAFMHALGGDGWLQTTAEPQGYWFAWGLFFRMGLFLIYSGSRGLRAK